MRLHCEHRIPLGADFFWAHLHDRRYEAMAAEAIGLKEYTELERSETADAVYRRIRVTPSLSGALEALLRRVGGAGRVSYLEEQWRSKHAMEVRWKMTPSLLAGRAQIEGVVRVEPIDVASCLRILDGEVRVRAFGVGALIERAIVENTIAAYGRSAAVAARL